MSKLATSVASLSLRDVRMAFQLATPGNIRSYAVSAQLLVRGILAHDPRQRVAQLLTVCSLIFGTLLCAAVQGWGDREAGDDVSAELTLRGTWQPAVASARQPTAAQALLDSLDPRQPDEQVPGGKSVRKICASKSR